MSSINGEGYQEYANREDARARCHVPAHLREEQYTCENCQERFTENLCKQWVEAGRTRTMCHECHREMEAAEARDAAEQTAALAPPPPAIMELQGNDTLVICAWCSTKEAADAWGKARGYTLSHSICPVCKPVHFPELAASEKAFAECLEAAKNATAYAAGVALDLIEVRASLAKCSVEELKRRDATVHAQAMEEAERHRQRLLAEANEANEGVPEIPPTDEELEDMALRDREAGLRDELITEGRLTQTELRAAYTNK